MFNIKQDGRFWLSVVLLVACVSFIPFIVMAPGVIRIGSLITIITIAVACGAGIAEEWKKIKKPVQKARAMFMEIIPLNASDWQNKNIKQMMQIATCATFRFADGTTHKLHFHSSKLEKRLPKFKGASADIYYKEYNGKYWLIGLDSTYESSLPEGPQRISIKSLMSILSIATCVFLITAGVLALTGGIASVDDQMAGKVSYSAFELEPLSEFYIELSIAASDKAESFVCAVNADTIYLFNVSKGIEIFLDKDENGNVVCAYGRDESSDEMNETIDEKYLSQFESQYSSMVGTLDFQQSYTKKQFRSLDVEQLGTAQIAGRECDHYSVKGTNGEIEIWLDQKTKYILKKEGEVDGQRYSFSVEKLIESGFEIPSYK